MFPSSLFYNTSARHDQHKCNTTATRVRHRRHECDTNSMIATQVKNFDFDNDTSEIIFSHPYINYIVNERLQGDKRFHSKNYLLETSCSHSKMCLKNAPQKLYFLMAKVSSKSYTLVCSFKYPCMFPHSYA